MKLLHEFGASIIAHLDVHCSRGHNNSAQFQGSALREEV